MQQLWAITGVNGFIGRALRANLEASGIAVRGLARSHGSEVRGDVRDPETVRALIRNADVVVHLAASVRRGLRGSEAARENWSVNVDGSQVLIDALVNEKRGAFGILISSASVYGPAEGVIDESTSCRPATPYGRSKLEAERRFLEAVRFGSIRGCVLRPAMTFGPGGPGNMMRLIRMVQTRLVPVANGGSVRKSIVPVQCVVAAIRAVAERQNLTSGEVFNVAGTALTIREIVNTIGASLQVKPRFIPFPAGAARFLASAADRILSVASTEFPSIFQLVDAYLSDVVLSDAKLQSQTSYSPPTSVHDALSETAAAPDPSPSTQRR